jgi:hypothetical protein
MERIGREVEEGKEKWPSIYGMRKVTTIFLCIALTGRFSRGIY